MASTPLPTPRALLTSLLNKLFTTPPSQPQIQTSSHAKTTNNNPNPLSALPASHRALLTTLHVLFPPPMLLQALDLLDRGLVTRLVLSPASSNSENENQSEGARALAGTALPDLHLPPSGDKDEARKTEEKEKANLYLVRSSQPQSSKGRFRDPTASSSGTIYTIHLTSWNCSCAAFAFAAFPSPSTTSPVPWDLPAEESILEDGDGREQEDEKEWQFGGLSLDGKDEGGGGVPVCKHLLACLLGERWDVVGGYVKERRVGREEMAGWAAGG